jgi:RNA polymerase sigma-70 factor (ECF subfamily)
MIKEWITKSSKQKQLKAVMTSHYPSLYKLAFAWTQEQSKAQDLVQDTMLRALEKADQIEGFEKIDRWLCKIMHYRFYDSCRHQKRWQMVDIEDAEQTPSHSVEHLYIQKQSIQSVHEAIGNLPLEQREVITLIDLHGYSYQEVSDITTAPIGTVMSRLSRAREKMKRLLMEERETIQYHDNLVEFK